VTSAWSGDPLSIDAWSRMRDHLVANAVDLDATPVTLGRPLRVSSAGDRVSDDPDATARLKRVDREPFAF
jgi:hypothetical protein